MVFSDFYLCALCLHIKWVPGLEQCHHSWAGLNGSLLSVATVAMETRCRWWSLSVTVVICFPFSFPSSLSHSSHLSFLNSFFFLHYLFFFFFLFHLYHLHSFNSQSLSLAVCLHVSLFPGAALYLKGPVQVILAAAGEGSDESLMVEKRVCGTLGTQRQFQLTCRKKERWRKEEAGEDMWRRVQTGEKKRLCRSEKEQNDSDSEEQ